MFLLFLAVVWAVLVFRLIAFRSTLSLRSLTTFLLLGASLGPMVVPLAEKFLNGYSWQGSRYYLLVICVAQHFVLMAPVLLLLSKPLWREGGSIADAFLAAFMTGLGYDLVCGVLSTASSPQVVNNFSFFPPAVASIPNLTVAGFGYWVGFAAVLMAAGLRFFGPWVGYAAGAAGLLLTGLDHLMADPRFTNGSFTNGSVESIPKFWLAITFQRSLFPWLAIAVLIALVVVEHRWVALRNAAETGRVKPFAGIQPILSAVVALRWDEVRRLGALVRLQRQREHMQASAGKPAPDASQRGLNAVGERIGRLSSASAAGSQPLTQSLMSWSRTHWLQLALVALAFWFFILGQQEFSRSLSTWIWTSFVVQTGFVPTGTTMLQAALMLILVWRYLIAPPAGFRGVVVDALAQSSGERRILQAGLGLVALTLLYPSATDKFPQAFQQLFSFQTPPLQALGWTVPGWNNVQLATLMLTLLAAVSGMTLRSSERWQAAAQTQRLPVAVHQMRNVMMLIFLSWLTLNLYSQAQTFAYLHWGPKMVVFLNSPNTNTVLELLLGAATVPFAIAAAWLTNQVMKRAESSLPGLMTGLISAPTSNPAPAPAEAFSAHGGQD